MARSLHHFMLSPDLVHTVVPYHDEKAFVNLHATYAPPVTHLWQKPRIRHSFCAVIVPNFNDLLVTSTKTPLRATDCIHVTGKR